MIRQVLSETVRCDQLSGFICFNQVWVIYITGIIFLSLPKQVIAIEKKAGLHNETISSHCKLFHIQGICAIAYKFSTQDKLIDIVIDERFWFNALLTVF